MHPKSAKNLWNLDPNFTFLNHGSYGACPKEILAEQQFWRDRIECQPVRFFKREYQPILNDMRIEFSEFISAQSYSLSFVGNATTAVNTVLANLELNPGDEIICGEYTYRACRNALEFHAQKHGAHVKYVATVLPVVDDEQIAESYALAQTPKTKFVFLDHVNSPLGLVFPIKKIIDRLDRKNVKILIDGAHAPGMLCLDLETIECDYYVGNFHKWLCAPKTGAFLACRNKTTDGKSAGSSEDIGIDSHNRGLIIGHASIESDPIKPLLLQDTDWPGTYDPSPILCIRKILEFFPKHFHSWNEHYECNNEMLSWAHAYLSEGLDVEQVVPKSMLTTMAPIVLGSVSELSSSSGLDPLQDHLYEKEGIEVPVINWNPTNVRLLRISAQAYNCREHFEKLADALRRYSRESVLGAK